MSADENTEDAREFNAHLKQAREMDLDDIERTGCVSQGMDQYGNHLIIMVPSLGMNRAEKPDVIFRMMLNLFLRKAHDIVGRNYAVVYAHTNIDILNQYPLIYKFYSILPRSYKKNLQKMYIIHPNMTIKMFFEFARVFLSHKFYAKLCLLENISDFQKLVPPSQLRLPVKFLRKEDEEKGLKYGNTLPPLSKTFDYKLGTTKVLKVCAEFIKMHGGLQHSGLFRIPGDDGELTLAKTRIQYALIDGDYSKRITLSEDKSCIVVGNMSQLQAGDVSESKKSSSTSSSNSFGFPDESTLSITAVSDLDTAAQIFKFSIRDLPEPLVPNSIYDELIGFTRKYESSGKYPPDWGHNLATALAKMPYENLSTFIFVVNFLRDVANHSLSNNMDSNNLAIIFSPSVFRPPLTDPMQAIMEVKTSQIVMKEIIERRAILSESTKIFFDANKDQEQNAVIFVENPIMSPALQLEGVTHSKELSKGQMQGMQEISQQLSPTMLDRLSRGTRGKAAESTGDSS